MNGCAPEFSAVREKSKRLTEDRVGIGKPKVQTQVFGLRDVLISLVLSIHFSTPSDCRCATVDKNVAARSSRFNTVQQLLESQ
jgi:hypothetical protein